MLKKTQAFGYKNNQAGCVYVVTSNFEKLRFYIDNAIEFIEFNLFTLSKTDFDILYLCLSFESIKNGLPKKVKDESLSQEDVITKKLYQDYSLFKRGLHQNLVSLNPQYDSLTLFRKSQKLLDRFLFLFFAEDRNLLPPNSVRLILNDWRDLQERDVEIPLYQRFKKYFEYLNTGFKGKRYDVFAYNGGLFKPDEVLDNILIDDELLFKHTSKLSDYDFVSEVDVNILGHIFENSLNELDEINAQITGEEIDKTKTRRKKDGVFYTPKYITKYIVENTVGKLCTEKKAELQIVEEEYATDKKRQLKTKQALLNKLKTYQNWLLQLTICDPACGSGAFLNQALDFLITEHRTIDELQAKLLGVPIIFSDIEKSILENNLFGVDLNEESVEIAKLSLWLRTAQPNRKLNDLNNNIKCGNSLISDPAVAGDKAFDWEREFPQVFGRKEIETPLIEVPKDKTPDYLKLIKEKSLEAQSKAEQALALSKEAADLSKKVYEYAEKLDTISDDDSLYGIRKGGFDVVIGNPPYGAKINSFEKAYYNQYYKTRFPNYDTYGLFFEKSYELLTDGGFLGFITPNTYLVIENGVNLRNLLFTKCRIRAFLETFNVFPDAVVEPITIILSKELPKSDNSFSCFLTPRGKIFSQADLSNYPMIEFSQSDLLERDDLIFNYQATEINRKLSQKIIEKTTQLGEIAKITAGVKPYEKTKGNPKQTEEIVLNKPYTAFQKFDSDWLKLIRGTQVTKYSLKWEGEFIKYGDCLAAPRNPDSFLEPKIFIRRTDDKILAAYDDEQIIGLNSIHCLQSKNENISLKFLLSILNSQLINWFFKFQNFHMVGKPLAEVKVVFVERLPIVLPDNQQPFVEKADQMLSLNKQLQETSQKFQRNIQREYNLEKLSAKLENWFQMPFKEFLKELEKSKVKLTLSQKAEWEDYFMQESKKALAIKNKIDATDQEIDQMVYSLYGLSEEEIKIVEGN
jgi:type I restriction-modification system DNA methylase subunit